MTNIALECRDCQTTVNYASDFMSGETPTLVETQYHVDYNFLARCWHCFACNWEVLGTSPTMQPHGQIEIVT